MQFDRIIDTYEVTDMTYGASGKYAQENVTFSAHFIMLQLYFEIDFFPLKIIQTIHHIDNMKQVCLKHLQIYV